MISATLLDEMRRISALLQAGEIRAAHDRLERIVADNPGFVEALRLLAGTRQVLGTFDRSLAGLRPRGVRAL